MEKQSKVLVVDDDPFALRSIADILRGECYQVVTTASSSEALELLKQDSFDLVLTDLKMPEVDGLEVLRQSREIAPQAVVLILTGYASVESAIEALREGAYDYLVKPCSADELKLKIERGLERVHLAEERQRAEEALRQRTAQLESLREVGLELTTQLDLDVLLHSIVSRAVELIGGNSGTLDLYRPDRDVLEWVVSVGLDQPPPKPFIHRGEGLCGKVWESGEPIMVDDYHRWEGRAAGWEGYPFKAVMGMPVHWGEEFLGVLEISAASPHTFFPADVELLSLFATQAAIAIRNARLYEEAQQRGLEQETASRIAYALNTPDVRDAFPVLVEGLQGLTGCDVVSLIAMDEAGEQFITTVLESPFPIPGEGEVMPFSATAAAEDVEAGRPHLTADLSTETHFPFEQALYQAGLRSWVTLPLLVGGEVFGTLGLGRSDTGLLRESQLPVLLQIADAVALALQNSFIFLAEREQREMAEALEAAAAAVSSTLEPDQVLDRILEQVERVVAGDAFNIMLIEGDDTARVVRWRGYERFGAEEFVSTVVFHIPEVLNLQQMMDSRKAMFIPDTADYPGWLHLPETEWLRSNAAAPIVVRGKVIGFLNVDSATPGLFTPAHAEALRVFADHAAAAIENARLYEETQRQSERLAQTLAVSELLHRDLELEQLLQQIAQGAVRLGFRRAVINVCRPGEELLRVRAIAGLEGPEREELMGATYHWADFQALMQERFQVSRSYLIRHGELDWEKDFQGVVVTPVREDRGPGYWRPEDMLLVPLWGTRGQPMGLLSMDEPVDGLLPDLNTIQTLEAFANQAAIAIQNARLFEEEKRRATQLALINEVGEKAASILDLDRLMQEITRSIQESFNYYNVTLLLLDDERRELAMQAIAGGFEHISPGEYGQSLDEGIIGFAARTGRSWLANDVSKDPHYVKGFLGEVLTKSELCVPIKLGDKVIGALDVQSIHLNDFDQADVAAMEVLADRVAISIETARLFAETERLKAFNESIVQGVAEAILIEDAQGILTFANPAAEGLLGYTREELIGLHWTAIVPEERLEKVQQEMVKRPQGIEGRYETALLSKGGQVIPVIVAARPLFKEGEFVGVLSAFTDITELKRTEESLAEERNLLRTLIDNLPDYIYVKDTEGRYFVSNIAHTRFLGATTLDEVVGKTVFGLFPQELAAQYYADDQEIIRSGQPLLNREERSVDQTGNRVWHLTTKVPLRDSQGKIMGLVGIARDITERKQAEHEIEERRVYLERVLAAAPDAIVTTDACHRVVEWNPGAERLFEYSREEAIGRNLDLLVTDSDTFEEAVGFTQIVMSGKEMPPTETIRYRKDGSPVDVIVAGSPILVGNELIGVVAVYTDITERVRMEETLRAMALVDDLTGLYNRRGFLTLGQQQLKTTNRAKRRMMLLFADFDDLKWINDTFGHPEGDRALIEVADVLRETFRESDIMARIAGDEFVVLAIETDGLPAEVLTTRLQENLEAHNAGIGRRYKLSLSVGLARYDPEHPCSIDELLAQADRSMYEKKQDIQKT